MEKTLNFSPDFKRKSAAIISVLILFFTIIAFLFQKNAKDGFVPSDNGHYELVKTYMQSEYTDAYSDFFEMAYVEELCDYKESFNADTNMIRADFVMKTHYKYPYRDPDTVPSIRNARENGDMKEYKKLYDEYNEVHTAEYKLRIDAKVAEEILKDITLYGGTDNEEWILLDNGLKEYITEE